MHLTQVVVVGSQISVLEEDHSVRHVAFDAVGAESVAALVAGEHDFVRVMSRHLAE